MSYFPAVSQLLRTGARFNRYYWHESEMFGSKCGVPNRTALCAVLLQHGASRDGAIGDQTKYHFRQHFWLCVPACARPGLLPQMRLPMRTRSPKLDVAMNQGKKGLFALVSIDRNEVLIDLNGENYFLSPTKRSLQIGEKRHVFGRDETVGFLNHSCEPNSFLDFSSLCVRALRHIQRGEEVKVNYAATEYEMHDSFRCDCGSSACLRLIKGFKFLTRDQQLELKPYLAPYLLKKLDEEISQDKHLIEKL
jgi:SET domain